MTITDAAELLAMDAAARRLSPLTLVFYRDRAKAIVKTVGDKRVDLITPTDLRAVLASCTEGTVLHNYSFMRRLFRFLVAEEILDRNPMVKLQPPKVESKVVNPLTTEEMVRCFKAAKAQGGLLGVRDAAIFATLVGTGLRREELCSLRDEDVRVGEGIMLIHGKGRKQRLVPIPGDLRVLLGQYLYRRRDSRAGGSCDRFFRDRNGTPMIPGNLTTLMGRLGRKVGVHLHPHRLRHTFATGFMSHDGSDVLHLKEICGWTTLAMANRYAKPSMAKMIRMVDSFSPVNDLR
jgi:site-specific recombinase XerD